MPASRPRPCSVTCFDFPLSEAKYVLDTINAGSLTDPLEGDMASPERFDRLCEVVQPVVTGPAFSSSGWVSMPR